MALTLSTGGQGGVFTLRGGSFGGRFRASVTPILPPSLLLDTYSGAAAAYSLRKLRTAYTGSAIRVRRSIDNTETDIGFVNNQLDTATLTTFCGIGNGFVTIWYDQSGNAKHASNTNTSLQPYVYYLGAVTTRNSKPTLVNSGYNYLTASTATGKGNGILYNWAFSVWSNDFLNPANCLAYEVGSNGGFFSGGTFGSIAFGISDGTGMDVYSTYEPVKTQLSLGTAKSSTTPQLWVDGALVRTGTTGFQSSFMTIYGGTLNSGQGVAGGIPELVFYNTDQTSNRTGIEANINSFYSIY